MKFVPRWILAWYNDADQALVRREVEWALKWLQRPIPRAATLIFLALVLGKYWILRTLTIWDRGMDWSAHRDSARILFAVAKWGGWSSWIIHGLLIWAAFSRRTLGPFEKGRVEELIMTPMSGSDLWPGLLFAPITIAAVPLLWGFGLEWTSKLVLGLVVPSTAWEFWGMNFLNPYNVFFAVMKSIWGVMAWMLRLAVLVGLIAYLAEKLIPNGIPVRVPVVIFWGFFLMILPSAVISIIGFYLMAELDIASPMSSPLSLVMRELYLPGYRPLFPPLLYNFGIPSLSAPANAIIPMLIFYVIPIWGARNLWRRSLLRLRSSDFLKSVRDFAQKL